MTTGTELLRREVDKTGRRCTDATGKKFGKLGRFANPEISPYEMYQPLRMSWMRMWSLKIFTSLSLDEIEEIQQFEVAPHERLALRSWRVKCYPWWRSLQGSPIIIEQLFAGNIKNFLTKYQNKDCGVPNYQVQEEDNLNIVELLVTAGVGSTPNAKPTKMFKMEPSNVNWANASELDYVLSDSDKLENELTVIRRGKKILCLTY